MRIHVTVYKLYMLFGESNTSFNKILSFSKLWQKAVGKLCIAKIIISIAVLVVTTFNDFNVILTATQ